MKYKIGLVMTFVSGLDQGTLRLGGYNILMHHDIVCIHLAMPSREQLQVREVGLCSHKLGKHHVTQKLSSIDPRHVHSKYPCLKPCASQPASPQVSLHLQASPQLYIPPFSYDRPRNLSMALERFTPALKKPPCVIIATCSSRVGSRRNKPPWSSCPAKS